MKNYRKTTILKYEKYADEHIPVIECIPRKDFPTGLRFYCAFCKRYHNHGEGEGHRIAHCHNSESPFDKTGYILKKRSRGKNETLPHS